MEHFSRCDERQAQAITRAIAAAINGQRVTFWMDAGVTKRTEDGQAVEVPNGTLSIHIYVNGGAIDQVVPERPKEEPRAD